MTHEVVYHFQDLYHTAVVDTYLADKPNLKDYPKENPEPDSPHHIAEKVPCFFNTKDWQHVMFQNIDIFYFINEKTVSLSLAMFLNIAIISYFLNLKTNSNEKKIPSEKQK